VGEDAEQRVRARIAEDGDGGLRPMADAHPDPGDVVGHFTAVGQDKGPLLVRPPSRSRWSRGTEVVARPPSVPPPAGAAGETLYQIPPLE